MTDRNERDPRRLVSTTEAAKALGLSQSTLSRWAARGYIAPAARTIGGYMRWDLDELRRQIKQRGGNV